MRPFRVDTTMKRRWKRPLPYRGRLPAGLGRGEMRQAEKAGDARERERERDASAPLTRPIKDTSLPHRPPVTSFHTETTLRTAPSLLRPGSSPESPSKRLKPVTRDRPKPCLIFYSRTPVGMSSGPVIQDQYTHVKRCASKTPGKIPTLRRSTRSPGTVLSRLACRRPRALIKARKSSLDWRIPVFARRFGECARRESNPQITTREIDELRPRRILHQVWARATGSAGRPCGSSIGSNEPSWALHRSRRSRVLQRVRPPAGRFGATSPLPTRPACGPHPAPALP